MRRGALAILLVSLTTMTALAGGHTAWRPPIEIRSAYPGPTVICPVPISPVIIYPRPIMPLAMPRAAPAAVGEESTSVTPRRTSTAEPPIAPPTTALRPGEPFFSVLPGPKGKERSDGLISVAFWNLTDRTLSVRIAGQDYKLEASRSLRLDLPAVFPWKAEGREAEATRLPAGHPTAEVLIRR